MPIIKSAIKRAKQTIKRRDRNVGIKRAIKSAVSTFSAKPSTKSLSVAHSEIDKAVKKGLIKKNTAARRKAQLAKKAKNAGTATVTKKTAVKPVAKKVAAKTTAKKAVAKKTAVKKTTAKKASK
ncbi:30S ribosomal protein S20 [Candidatus Saccharibacteria bacterium]|nr:30S ribosomal protein S20 [Candidatus Saccharibacteria bacterium]